MKKPYMILTAVTITLSSLQANEQEYVFSEHTSEPAFEPSSFEAFTIEESAPPANSSFSPFTGLVRKNKVRLRLHPSLDSEVVQELNQGDLLIVSGEEGEFYEVKPSNSVKGYIFRTYVLDGQIEGNRVNVRLGPSTDAPVVGQLNTGDRIQGQVCKENHKWYEVALPENVTFYIAKDLVRNVGDPSYFSIMKVRLSEVQDKLAKAYAESINTLRQSYTSMNPELVRRQFGQIIQGYEDFPDYVEKARQQLQSFEDKYLEKKIAFLESGNNEPVEIETNQSALAAFHTDPSIIPFQEQSPASQPHWSPLENQYYQQWQETHPEGTLEQFYQDEAKTSTIIRGIIKPYSKNIKNKPGDFILVTQFDRPIAFLYSTKIDLQTLSGKQVQLKVVQRPNNNFAFPAYFVLSQ